MNQLSKIETFWQSYLSTLSEAGKMNTRTYAVDQFADTPEAATELSKLVRDGVKTTTSSLVWGLEHIGEPIPKVGNIDLIVDGNGEGERTLAYWLRDTWDFHSRWCIEIGREPSETMPIVFQRFRVLYS